MFLGGQTGPLVQDVFDIQLWAGNATSGRVINFDMAGDLFWVKRRTNSAGTHVLSDKVRGGNNWFATNATGGANTTTDQIQSMVGASMTIGDNATINGSAANTYVGWAFKEQAGFFDIVTYAGTGSAHSIAHSLGVVPAMIIVKRLDTTGSPTVYHIGANASPGTVATAMETTNAFAAASTAWNDTDATTSQFTVGTSTAVNANGGSYIAYIWAHNPSGFIQGGSYTGTGSAGLSVNLGWEPQFLLIKQVNTANQWLMLDATRGMVSSGVYLLANTSAAESAGTYVSVSGAGFTMTSGSGLVNTNGGTYAYLAIKAE